MTEEQQTALVSELEEINKISGELLEFFGLDESKSIEKLTYVIEPDTIEECLERYYAAIESEYDEDDGGCLVIRELHEDEYNEAFGRDYFDNIFDLKMALTVGTYSTIESVMESCDVDDYI